MRRTVLGGLLVVLVLTAGCSGGNPYGGVGDFEQAAPVGFSAVSVDGGPADWIQITVHDGQDGYAHEDLNVTVVAPDGTERVGFVCDTSEGSWEEGCQDPFEPGESVAAGDQLWIPCQGPGDHRITVEIAPYDMVDGPAECEAEVGGSGPESAEITRRTHDPDADGSVDWLELVLDAGDSAPYAPDQVQATVEGPDGDTRGDLLCQTANGSWTEGCQQPFQGEAEWRIGGSLFVPCQANGDHRVTVDVRGTTQLDGGFFCDQAA